MCFAQLHTDLLISEYPSPVCFSMVKLNIKAKGQGWWGGGADASESEGSEQTQPFSILLKIKGSDGPPGTMPGLQLCPEWWGEEGPDWGHVHAPPQCPHGDSAPAHTHTAFCSHHRSEALPCSLRSGHTQPAFPSSAHTKSRSFHCHTQQALRHPIDTQTHFPLLAIMNFLPPSSYRCKTTFTLCPRSAIAFTVSTQSPAYRTHVAPASTLNAGNHELHEYKLHAPSTVHTLPV